MLEESISLEGGFKHLIASVSFRQDENDNASAKKIARRFGPGPGSVEMETIGFNPPKRFLGPDSEMGNYSGALNSGCEGNIGATQTNKSACAFAQ